MLRLRIQSTSDLITNSSSEVFVIKAGDYSFDEVKELIESVAKSAYDTYKEDWTNNCRKKWDELERDELDGCSGMGGDLSILGWRTMYEQRKEWRSNYTVDKFIEDENLEPTELDKYIWIDIDWARRATISFILDNFEIVNEEVC